MNTVLGGGYPRGRIIEIYGPESSGKTTLALHALAEIQKTGGSIHASILCDDCIQVFSLGTAAFIDVEHALDPTYAVRYS